MRVTNKMLSNNFLRDMNVNLNNLRTLQGQMTSGKEVRRPSDNPFKVARIMQIYSDIDANNQYNENISDMKNWLDTTDTAIGQADETIQRIRQLMLSAGNAGYGSGERGAIKDEINERIGEFSQILNTTFEGKYIFGGTRGTIKPVDVTKNASKNAELYYYDSTAVDGKLNGTTTAGGIQYNQIKSKIVAEISQGVTLDYNVSASEIINFPQDKVTADTPDNIMDLFANIVKHLDDPNDTSKITGDDLGTLDKAFANLLKVRSEVGARVNRLESAEEVNTEQMFNMTEILSKNEDIDITEKTMEYATMQTVYIASLQTSAKVLQPSLMDYLR